MPQSVHSVIQPEWKEKQRKADYVLKSSYRTTMSKMKVASPRTDTDGAEHFHPHFKAEEEKRWPKTAAKDQWGQIQAPTLQLPSSFSSSLDELQKITYWSEHIHRTEDQIFRRTSGPGGDQNKTKSSTRSRSNVDEVHCGFCNLGGSNLCFQPAETPSNLHRRWGEDELLFLMFNISWRYLILMSAEKTQTQTGKSPFDGH